MSQRDPIRVFVTHDYQAGEDYLRVFEYLESARNFYYRNVSTPDKPPAGAGIEARREDLRRQINGAEVVVALGSLASAHSEMLVFQVNYAKASDKPVVLLSGFGKEIVVPRYITDLADEKVDWDERGLVDAIRRQARHEESTRWDTIEFKLD